ncbi:MAG: patatin-like phospholipase family protein [Candidatus Doudnabacteria bacterium]|nr:patatin-like phospholipase family protein [Candidatus Doudnabacteria bacterium]
MPDKNARPTIGVALSGGASRAITEIGVLEVFKEHGIPIDYMVGCSSGSFVAVACANDKLEHLKQWMMSMNLQKVISMWSWTAKKGGLFEFGEGEKVLMELVSDLTFENAYPKLGFTAADLNSGDLVTLSMGDIVTAVKASNAVPGLFPPVVWGDKLLVDGGLLNIVPTKPVRDMGADIVIGINVSGARFIYEKRLPYWRLYRMLTKYMGISYLSRKQMELARKVLDLIKFPKEKSPRPGIIRILTKSFDHSLAVSDKWTDADMECDCMITPKVKQWGKTELNRSNLERIYQEGRKAATEAMPRILNLINNYGSGKIQEKKDKGGERQWISKKQPKFS